jgi:hypothetical protein
VLRPIQLLLPPGDSIPRKRPLARIERSRSPATRNAPHRRETESTRMRQEVER